jgi:thiamine-monophosphate kinase
LTTTLREFGERALLARLRERLDPPGGAGVGVVIGLGDDAAAVATSGLTLITTDALVEDVHFRVRSISPADLGRKAIAVNVSDIAAMGGRPRYATVSLCLPGETEVAFVEALYDGLLEASRRYSVALVGGNLAAIDGPMVIDIAMLGEPGGGAMLTRDGACAGDLLAVTGTLGGAAAGLLLLEAGEHLMTGLPHDAVAACLRAQWTPEPPLAFAAAVGGAALASAAMDLSDGLSADLLALCRESRAGASLDVALLPVAAHTVSVASALGLDPLGLALHGGEDYQLLLAAPPRHFTALVELAGRHATRLTVIGVVADEAHGVVDARTGRTLQPNAFQHFAGGS